MGTNFYAFRKLDTPCTHCLGTGFEHVKTHIGKSSGGWTFSFHAPTSWEIYPNDWSAHENAKEIVSFNDWLDYLKDNSARIFNEYGEELTLREFYDLVESKRSERNNHTTYIKTDPKYRHTSHADECFLDSAGHSFSKGEFS